MTVGSEASTPPVLLPAPGTTGGNGHLGRKVGALGGGKRGGGVGWMFGWGVGGGWMFGGGGGEWLDVWWGEGGGWMFLPETNMGLPFLLGCNQSEFDRIWPFGFPILGFPFCSVVALKGKALVFPGSLGK